MGDVIVVLRVIPKDMEIFDQVRKDLEKLKPQRLEEEPIAFGLKGLKFTKVIPDEEGSMTRLEEDLKKIEGVQNVEILTVSRSL